uniref:Uncharacterized protein n=1 Tax=uncultured marine group II/III euryarchaeote KM3_181_A09 TaxID=1457943 RepID=A0A075GTW7_9EURY|nr:hypothetical protein [uncultured marine group II/III euryarchaeote KM3_181_A09]
MQFPVGSSEISGEIVGVQSTNCVNIGTPVTHVVTDCKIAISTIRRVEEEGHALSIASEATDTSPGSVEVGVNTECGSVGFDHGDACCKLGVRCVGWEHDAKHLLVIPRVR